ncbi:MAG: NAD(P)/FAD-dependent oxidoreductase [Eubacterium sp.]|nr:NAD(P)/FAD-dependent oxidoreductase [Eubacterium sp.]
MYDVIVIGAGPAGSTAAKVLAEKGYQVLLLEKFKMPRYKSCSGILIQKTMNLVAQYLNEEIPESVTCVPADNRGMVFTNDRGKEYLFEQKGLNIWRSSFDYWLAQKAQDCGAVVRDDAIVLHCEEKERRVCVTLREKNPHSQDDGTAAADTYTEEARYVIDCEGVGGMLKHKLLKTAPAYITTFQTFSQGSIALDPHYFYAYLQPELSEYDAWFNVKDDLIVLGVAGKDTGRIRQFYDRFLTYMKRCHHLQLQKQLKSEKWLMPQIRPGCHIDYGIGRVLFAGEAAGFLNPMGEGISAAMESGYHAASAAACHFGSLERIYADYRQNVEGLRGYMQRQWSLVGSMAGTFREME